MVRDTDIAWLAGVFDGEGCVYVLRVRRKSIKSGMRIVPSLELVLANTSAILLERYTGIIRMLGVEPRVVVEAKYGTRPIYYVKVSRKADALVVAKAILPQSTSKRAELQMAIWYLERSCKSRQHVATTQDREVLDAITSVKHGVAIPDSIRSLIDN